MTKGALEVETPKVPLPSPGRPGAPLRIVCPTYWYPQHASDTQATYVHDINRHLVRRATRSPWSRRAIASLPAEDSFDGVDIVRFPMELPSDLTYGRVAQSQVSLLGRFARLAVMAHYLEAQYRATVSVGRDRGADVVHAHWAIPTGPAAVLAARQARGAQRHHDARRRRLRESGAGLRFPHPVVRAPAAALDAAPRGRAHRDHRRLPPARVAGRCARAMHPTGVQRHRSPSFQPLTRTARRGSALRAAHDLRLPAAVSPEGDPVPGRGSRAAEAAVPRAQAGARGRWIRAPDPRPSGRGARHRRRRSLPRLGAERGAAAVLSRRRGLGHSLAGGGIRHPGGGGDGL